MRRHAGRVHRTGSNFSAPVAVKQERAPAAPRKARRQDEGRTAGRQEGKVGRPKGGKAKAGRRRQEGGKAGRQEGEGRTAKDGQAKGWKLDEMGDRSDILQGTLDLMVLQTLDVMGPLHGYGIARRIEQISDDVLQLNQGTDLRVAAPPAAAPLDHRELGHLREQPAREILRDHARRAEAARRRGRALDADCRRHRPAAAAGRALMPC